MFAKMKTGTKVLGGFGFAIAIALVVGFVGYRGINKLSGHVEEIGIMRLPSVASSWKLRRLARTSSPAQQMLLNVNLPHDVRNSQHDVVAKVRRTTKRRGKSTSRFRKP